eukprot:scaffold1211_cov169-Amphora_coffeaeformis.AAC.3
MNTEKERVMKTVLYYEGYLPTPVRRYEWFWFRPKQPCRRVTHFSRVIYTTATMLHGPRPYLARLSGPIRPTPKTMGKPFFTLSSTTSSPTMLPVFQRDPAAAAANWPYTLTIICA